MIQVENQRLSRVCNRSPDLYIGNEQKKTETFRQSELPSVFYLRLKKKLPYWWDQGIHTLMMANANFGSNWPSVFRDVTIPCLICILCKKSSKL